MTLRYWAAGMIAITAFCLHSAKAADLPKLLVFNTVLFDALTTGEGNSVVSPEEKSQVERTADVLRAKMAETGRYQVLPAPKSGSDDIDLSCGECILKEAHAAGADFVLTSAVNRVSATVMVLTVELDDVANQKAVSGGKVELRGLNAEAMRGAAVYAADKYFAPAAAPSGAEKPEIGNSTK
ncbi:MAG: DUF2380 domain-containing protein [Alphaproteobacteria bacterium]